MNYKQKVNSFIMSSELPHIQKMALTGYVSRVFSDDEKRQATVTFLEGLGIKNVSDIILSTEEYIIYTVYGKDGWDKECPYRSIVKKQDGTWRRCNTVAPTLDTAMLVALGLRHDGENSQFHDFAIKMLGIKIENNE